MRFITLYLTIAFLLAPQHTFSQSSTNFWKISGRGSIVWDISREIRLPHTDNMEMAGRKVAAIIYYTVDENKQLQIERDIIYPQLRIFNKTTDPDWMEYRAYLRHTFRDDLLPVITHLNKTWIPGTLDSVEIEGKLTFHHHAVGGLRLHRTLFPSMHERMYVEKWEIANLSDKSQEIRIGNIRYENQETGFKGVYRQLVYSDAQPLLNLAAGESYSFAIYYTAVADEEPFPRDDFRHALTQRDSFLLAMRENLVLATPDPVLNTLFYFSKIRAAENLFDTKMGLVHSPGGGNYYAGIWANDQAEYSSPFFPFLGYRDGNIAAYNCYMWFLKNLPAGYGPVTSSFEIEGDLTCCGKDRGDAAMIAYGASQFALLRADKKIAMEIWPLIEWSLEYCHRQKNAQGVIRSVTDEMEGRISTGDANLATSSLYYGGLQFASRLAKELGKKDLARQYDSRAAELGMAIEKHFGATIEGLETYRYFDGNVHLRHWICLPLVMGIENRKEATIDALLSKLWTPDGVLVELNPDSKQGDVFWDRGTLYALRGTFKAGATEESYSRLYSFSEKRLLGDHVPYVIEAYPENNMRHLSAESALYCRIYLEGLLGFEQTGFGSFTFTPRLPDEWAGFCLQNMHFGDTSLTIEITKAKNDRLVVSVKNGNVILLNKSVPEGKSIDIKF